MNPEGSKAIAIRAATPHETLPVETQSESVIGERLLLDHTHESLTEIKELVDMARSLLTRNGIEPSRPPPVA